ncbi:unnamed protein product [Owenia fusiformis]|uniref:Uncharacterized protein n=1 Tax=Owenia fusiformis TaxID=6347 RepID=A0A8S4N4L8_OWEFU|nr:unnamed protein product [Owenia fusiformis]
MPWRSLMRYLVNNEQLIQKLAESYPIRRAAQLTAYFYHRSKSIGNDLKDSGAAQKLQDDANFYARQTENKLSNFKKTFTQDVTEGFKKLQDDIKKQQKK